MNAPKPLLIVLSSPSGGGKSTLCDRLLADFQHIVYSVSCTTREPRGAEVDGEDYIFMTQGGFQERVARGEFLEHATVHGNLYGTLAATVHEALSEGQSVLLDIDVAGAAQVRAMVAGRPPDDPLRTGFLDIFVSPPSLAELRRRLVLRKEDTLEAIELRMENAQEEMRAAPLYRHVVVNDDLERAYGELRDILLAAQGG